MQRDFGRWIWLLRLGLLFDNRCWCHHCIRGLKASGVFSLAFFAQIFALVRFGFCVRVNVGLYFLALCDRCWLCGRLFYFESFFALLVVRFDFSRRFFGRELFAFVFGIFGAFYFFGLRLPIIVSAAFSLQAIFKLFKATTKHVSYEYEWLIL